MAASPLEAENVTAKSASFIQALAHLNLAVVLLPQRHWKDEHLLSLDLRMAAAEVEHCNGNFARMNELIDAISRNSQNKEDGIRAVVAQILALSSDGP